MENRIRIGISVPNFGTFADPAVLVDLARRAESAGWNGFFLWDHVVVGDGVPVADPWVALGAIAQATTSIRIGPMVAALPRHRPWIVARQAVSLDHLSDGRMVLGVGLGFPPDVEFGTFGDPEDDRTRADMADEALQIICGVWSGRPFSFSGEHYQVDLTAFAPVPIQQPRIPIWVAAMLPNRRPLRRAARYDGVVPIRTDMALLTVDDIVETSTYIHRHRPKGEPFDFAVSGPPITRGELAPMAAAGLTWYLAGPNPAGEPIDETLAWVSEGPDRYVVPDS